MGYVEYLLRSKLEEHRNDLARLAAKGELEHQASILKSISELVYVLNWLNDDETYKKY